VDGVLVGRVVGGCFDVVEGVVEGVGGGGVEDAEDLAGGWVALDTGFGDDRFGDGGDAEWCAAGFCVSGVGGFVDLLLGTASWRLES
jgi:hypothetical protein